MTDDPSPEEMAWWDEMRQPVAKHAKRTPRRIPRDELPHVEIPPAAAPFFTADIDDRGMEDEALAQLMAWRPWWVRVWRHVQAFGERAARGHVARPVAVFTIWPDTRAFDFAAAKLIDRLETSPARRFWRRTP
jgi:hypothetical protein